MKRAHTLKPPASSKTKAIDRDNLRPMKVVPASEAWVHEPEVQYQLAKAAKWLKETPRSETPVDALARKARKRK